MTPTGPRILTNFEVGGATAHGVAPPFRVLTHPPRAAGIMAVRDGVAALYLSGANQHPSYGGDFFQMSREQERFYHALYLGIRMTSVVTGADTARVWTYAVDGAWCGTV